jgi:hypothetical protein
MGSASGQDGGLPIMLSKDGASLLQRVRLDKFEPRQYHLIPPALVLPNDMWLVLYHSTAMNSFI